MKVPPGGGVGSPHARLALEKLSDSWWCEVPKPRWGQDGAWGRSPAEGHCWLASHGDGGEAEPRDWPRSWSAPHGHLPWMGHRVPGCWRQGEPGA